MASLNARSIIYKKKAGRKILTGIVKELRSRQQFDKPSVVNRLKKERAVYVQKLQQVED